MILHVENIQDKYLFVASDGFKRNSSEYCVRIDIFFADSRGLTDFDHFKCKTLEEGIARAREDIMHYIETNAHF